MSDFLDQGTAPGSAGAPAPAGSSAGAVIRRAREDAGVHIAALAVSLKVPVKRLEALEADRYDELPDLVFARALALSVCRSLKLQPERVLPLLPQGQVQQLSVEGPINEPFRPDSQTPGSGALGSLPKPVVWAAVALVLAAVAVYAVPQWFGAAGDAQPAALPAPSPAPGALAAPMVPAPADPATSGAAAEPTAPSGAAPGAPTSLIPPTPAVVPAPVLPAPAAPPTPVTPTPR